MIYGTFGIYHGGEVTIGSHVITIAAAILRDVDGNNFGVGERTVALRFGQAVDGFVFSVSARTDFQLPALDLSIGATAGSAYLVFTPLLDSRDSGLDIVSAASSGQIVLATLSWAANANTIAQSSAARNVTRLIEAKDPLRAGDLYRPGMDISDASFNAPLISSKILAEAYQAELKLRHGSSYAIALLRLEDLIVSGNSVTFPPFEVVRRISDEAGERFSIILTRQSYTFTYVLANLVGERIRILVNPLTGVVTSSIDPAASGIVATYVDIKAGDTVSGLKWIWDRAQQTKISLSVTKYSQNDDVDQAVVASAPWPTPFSAVPTDYVIALVDNGKLPADLINVGMDLVGVRLSVTKGQLIAAIGQPQFSAAPIGKSWGGTFLVTAKMGAIIDPEASDDTFADGSLVAGG